VVGAKREKMVDEEDTPNDEDVAMDVN